MRKNNKQQNCSEDFHPKKSLGQNFLEDKNALKKIVDAAELTAEDKVLEIGPGKGALTRELLKKTKNLILVEKDKQLADLVATNFKFEILNFKSILNFQNYNFKNQRGVASGDILEINLPKLIEENNFYNYKVVANIPYYITGKLLRLFLETKHPPKLLVLLLQKEVAERICASPREVSGKCSNVEHISRGKTGDMSILSVSVQYFGVPQIVGYVPKESFNPIPKVDSAIIKIKTDKNIKKLQLQGRDFFRLVKIGFSSPRKTLINNLSSGLGISKGVLGEAIVKIGINENARAQELSVEDWKKLALKLAMQN